MSLACLAAFVAAATAASLVASAEEPDADVVAKGKQVYGLQRCKLCHSVGGEGNPKGPHDAVGSRLKPEEMRQWLLEPREMAEKAKATRTPPMIPYTHLTPEELDALVAYLSSLKAPAGAK